MFYLVRDTTFEFYVTGSIRTRNGALYDRPDNEFAPRISRFPSSSFSFPF